MKFCTEWADREFLMPSRRRDMAIFLFRRFVYLLAILSAFGADMPVDGSPPCPWFQWVPWRMVTVSPVANGCSGSRGPWLQKVPWPMVATGPMAHGDNGSQGSWQLYVPWPMVATGSVAHGYNGSHGPCLQWVP